MRPSFTHPELRWVAADAGPAGGSRDRVWAAGLLLGLGMSALCLAGCFPEGRPSEPDKVWGRRGFSAGRLQKPRAIAIDAQDRLYVVDMTARIQVFDADGNYLRGWKTPECTQGRPTGLSMDRQGNLLVADTHYYRVLTYSPDGQLLRTFGGKQGSAPGQFGWVTDCVQDRDGNYYVSEYGEFDRIQKLDPQGNFLREWGGHGSEPGQFSRPQSLAFDREGQLWVTDACNHRIQVFDTQGGLLRVWGEEGAGQGQLLYPYDLVVDAAGDVYVCEYGNHRVQKFTSAGRSLGSWGTHGRSPGQLHNPWGLVLDREGRLHVLDSNNHRVQRVIF